MKNRNMQAKRDKLVRFRAAMPRRIENINPCALSHEQVEKLCANYLERKALRLSLSQHI